MVAKFPVAQLPFVSKAEDNCSLRSASNQRYKCRIGSNMLSLCWFSGKFEGYRFHFVLKNIILYSLTQYTTKYLNIRRSYIGYVFIVFYFDCQSKGLKNLHKYIFLSKNTVSMQIEWRHSTKVKYVHLLPLECAIIRKRGDV